MLFRARISLLDVKRGNLGWTIEGRFTRLDYSIRGSCAATPKKAMNARPLRRFMGCIVLVASRDGIDFNLRCQVDVVVVFARKKVTIKHSYLQEAVFEEAHLQPTIVVSVPKLKKDVAKYRVVQTCHELGAYILV